MRRHWIRARAWLATSDAITAHWLRAARDALLGEMPILAGGTALFAIFAVVPTLAAAVAIYGVAADPAQINEHLKGLETVIPGQVAEFLREQLERQARQSKSELGVALAVTVLVAVWSARSAARALIDSLNRAYRVRERRTTLVKLATTVAMGAVTVGGILVLLAVVAALPVIFAMLRLDGFAVIEWLRWPAFVALLFGLLLLLYRYGPSPRQLGAGRHLWPGAATATLLLLLVSFGLSLWVSNIARYDLWYGAFGSAVVLMLWFYLAVIALVIGGFVNAELERHAGAPAPDRSMY